MKRLLLASFILAFFLVSCGTRRGAVLSGKRPNQGTIKGTPNKGAVSMTGLAYIEKYKGIAIQEMNKYGIPASIKLAQALLESGNGNSYLAVNANNHFGIKCGGSWNGKSISRPDDRADDCFRVYSDPEQSFKDHSRFLLRKRYESLFALKKDDYKGWAKGLKQAGYATNPRYPDLLIDLIERYDLQQYDRAEAPAEVIARSEKVDEIIQEKEIIEPQKQQPEKEIKRPVAMKIYEVKAGDTLASIATRFQTTAAELREINGLSSDTMSAGQLLVVSK